MHAVEETGSLGEGARGRSGEAADVAHSADIALMVLCVCSQAQAAHAFMTHAWTRAANCCQPRKSRLLRLSSHTHANTMPTPESYIRSTEEASQRECAWNELNRDYIEKQAEKARVEEMKDASAPHDRQGKRKRRPLDNSISSTAHEVLHPQRPQQTLTSLASLPAVVPCSCCLL